MGSKQMGRGEQAVASGEKEQMKKTGRSGGRGREKGDGKQVGGRRRQNEEGSKQMGQAKSEPR